MSNTEKLIKILNNLKQISYGSNTSFGKAPYIYPGLCVSEEKVGELAFPLQKVQAEELRRVCSTAACGRNDRGIWQLSKDMFSFENPDWNSGYIDKLVDNIALDYDVECNSITYDLDKLILFEEGCFYKGKICMENKETFGTLLIALPSKFEGGSLELNFDKNAKLYEFDQQSKNNIQYLAFYNNCEQQIHPVTYGYCICLAYALSFKDGKKIPRFNNSKEIETQLIDLMKTPETAIIKLQNYYANLPPPSFSRRESALVELFRRVQRQSNNSFNLYLANFDPESKYHPLTLVSGDPKSNLNYNNIYGDLRHFLNDMYADSGLRTSYNMQDTEMICLIEENSEKCNGEMQGSHKFESTLIPTGSADLKFSTLFIAPKSKMFIVEACAGGYNKYIKTVLSTLMDHEHNPKSTSFDYCKQLCICAVNHYTGMYTEDILSALKLLDDRDLIVVLFEKMFGNASDCSGKDSLYDKIFELCVDYGKKIIPQSVFMKVHKEFSGGCMITHMKLIGRLAVGYKDEKLFNNLHSLVKRHSRKCSWDCRLCIGFIVDVAKKYSLNSDKCKLTGAFLDRVLGTLLDTVIAWAMNLNLKEGSRDKLVFSVTIADLYVAIKLSENKNLIKTLGDFAIDFTENDRNLLVDALGVIQTKYWSETVCVTEDPILIQFAVAAYQGFQGKIQKYKSLKTKPWTTDENVFQTCVNNCTECTALNTFLKDVALQKVKFRLQPDQKQHVEQQLKNHNLSVNIEAIEGTIDFMLTKVHEGLDESQEETLTNLKDLLGIVPKYIIIENQNQKKRKMLAMQADIIKKMRK